MRGRVSTRGRTRASHGSAGRCPAHSIRRERGDHFPDDGPETLACGRVRAFPVVRTAARRSSPGEWAGFVAARPAVTPRNGELHRTGRRVDLHSDAVGARANESDAPRERDSVGRHQIAQTGNRREAGADCGELGSPRAGCSWAGSAGPLFDGLGFAGLGFDGAGVGAAGTVAARLVGFDPAAGGGAGCPKLVSGSGGLEA